MHIPAPTRSVLPRMPHPREPEFLANVHSRSPNTTNYESCGDLNDWELRGTFLRVSRSLDGAGFAPGDGFMASCAKFAPQLGPIFG